MKRSYLAAGLALACVLAVAGCSSSDPSPGQVPSVPTTVPPNWTPDPVPTGTPGTPVGGVPDPADVDMTNPDAVTTAALTAMFTMDTAIDLSPSDADRRAIPWLSESFAEGVRAGSPDAGGTDWLTLAGHKGYTVVNEVLDATEVGGPADTAQKAYRIYLVTYTPTGRDGWTGQRVTAAFYIVLARAGSTQPWRVDSLTAA